MQAPMNMNQPYGGSALPGTQVPDLGSYKHPASALPTPLPQQSAMSKYGMSAGMGAQAQDPSQGIGMGQLQAMGKRTGQKPYEDFMSSRGYKGLPYGLLGG
jgi:hypothetical protein